MVAGAFLCMMTGYAVAYSFAAFFGALESEFGARRGETALVFSISAFLYFLLGFPAGLIADRIGPRPVVIGGLLLIAVGLVAAAQASSLWQIYLGYGARRRRGHRPLLRAERRRRAALVRAPPRHRQRHRRRGHRRRHADRRAAGARS